MTVLATVLAAPLLLVEIAPGVDATTPDAALAAFSEELAAEITAPAEAPVNTAGRGFGSVSGADVTSGRLLSTLTVGEELRAEADAAAEEAAALEALAEAEEEERLPAEREAAEREAAERAAAERAAAATTTTTSPPPPPPAPAPAPSGGPTPEQWAALRQCESGGNYGAVNPAGPYYGAYQFLQQTWNGVASSVGRGDLVGVRPDHAAPGDQDAMAQALYAQRGTSPWPHCGRYLR